MRDGDIDDVLKRAADGTPGVDPALPERIACTLGSSLQAVRPLPAGWILASGLVLICVAVAAGGAMLLKPLGIQKMSAWEIGVIFPVLGVLIWLAGVVSVAEVIPGSRRLAAPGVLLFAGCAALAGVFGLLFHDYGTERFVAQGMKCLTAGLAHAIPVSIAAAWLVRRGFAVNSAAAGMAQGMLAGLAGVTMLELHCVNFEAPHVMVWHIAVMAISAAAGGLIASALHARRC